MLVSRWRVLEYIVDPVNGVVSALAGISIDKHLLDVAQRRQGGSSAARHRGLQISEGLERLLARPLDSALKCLSGRRAEDARLQCLASAVRPPLAPVSQFYLLFIFLQGVSNIHYIQQGLVKFV